MAMNEREYYFPSYFFGCEAYEYLSSCTSPLPQLRLGWKETDSPLLELSRQLMTEARAHAQSDPQHFLSPSIPLEVRVNLPLYFFAQSATSWYAVF
jgi:hypothetical protein